MGNIKQAEMWLKYLFFPVSAAHSVSSAQTLQLKRQQSTHMLKGVLPDYFNPAFSWKLDIFWQFNSAYDGYPKRKLALLKKECFIFRKRRVYKKKNSSISYKNTCAKEKISCNYGTFAQHQNLCWRYLSRHSNRDLGTPDYAVLIKIAFPPCISFQWKIFIHYRDNHTITKLLQKEDSSSCW